MSAFMDRRGVTAAVSGMWRTRRQISSRLVVEDRVAAPRCGRFPPRGRRLSLLFLFPWLPCWTHKRLQDRAGRLAT